MTTTNTQAVVVNSNATDCISVSELTECEALLVKEDEDDDFTPDDFSRWVAYVTDIVAGSKALKSFSWTARNVSRYEDSGMTIPSTLWNALGSLQNLEKLHLTLASNDHDDWVALIEGSGLSNLRSFRLNMESGHGWDGGPLERFLVTLRKLEDLELKFPTCCGPLDISLPSTFPNLKSLRLTSYISSPVPPRSRLSRDLLHRHHKLEHLYLDCDYDFALSPHDLANLKYLGVGDSTLYHNALISTRRPIQKLYMNISFSSEVKDLALTMKNTLRVLELKYTSIRHFRQHAEELLPLFLPSLTRLEEVYISATAANSSPRPPQFTESDVLPVLKATKTSNIKTLRFTDWCDSGQEFSPAFLSDIGRDVAHSLERIIWKPNATAKSFRVKRAGKEPISLELEEEGVLWSPDDVFYG